MWIKSMTAYAGAEAELGSQGFNWEIRSVNHRYLDIALRLPETFRFLEAEIRSRIGQKVKRGRLDVILAQKKTQGGETGLQLDQALLKQLLNATRQIEAESGLSLSASTALDLLRWPGVIHETEIDREQLTQPLLELLDLALGKLVAEREREGAQLAELIATRCEKMRVHIAAVRERMPEVLLALRQKITTRINEVVAQPDQNRLEQELVYLAQKLDVAEELDRIETHIGETLKTLKGKEPAGRRLDFLLQEMNREANTLGSKSADAETTKASVELKVLIEQMREQIQNIE